MYEVRDECGVLLGTMTLDCVALMVDLSDETRARIENAGMRESLLRSADGRVVLALRRVCGIEDVPEVLRMPLFAGMIEEASGYDLWEVVSLMMLAMEPEEMVLRVRECAAFSGVVH